MDMNHHSFVQHDKHTCEKICNFFACLVACVYLPWHATPLMLRALIMSRDVVSPNVHADTHTYIQTSSTKNNDPTFHYLAQYGEAAAAQKRRIFRASKMDQFEEGINELISQASKLAQKYLAFSAAAAAAGSSFILLLGRSSLTVQQTVMHEREEAKSI